MLYKKISLLSKSLHTNFLSFFLFLKSLSLLVWINIISLTLLLFVSPILGGVWLVIVTLYLLFKGRYKNIFMVWGLFFSVWYFFFTFFLLDYKFPIVIGGDDSLMVLMHISERYSFGSDIWRINVIKSFCVQTYMLLCILSSKLGFPIYVPSLLKAFMVFLKFISRGGKGGEGPVNCAGEENSSTNGSSSIFTSIFERKGASESKPKVHEDFKHCEHWREVFSKERWRLIKSADAISGTKFVEYHELKIPFYNTYTFCLSRNATKEEIQNHKDKTK